MSDDDLKVERLPEEDRRFFWRLVLAVLGLIVIIALLDGCQWDERPDPLPTDAASCYADPLHVPMNLGPVRPSCETTDGWRVAVMTSAGFDGDLLDARLAAMDAALRIATEGGLQTEPAWMCGAAALKPTGVPRCTLFVVIEPVVSQCTGWELLPVEADPQMCRDKGMEPTPQCPCRWRTAPWHGAVVTTPHHAPVWTAVELASGCRNAWASPQLAEAMTVAHSGALAGLLPQREIDAHRVARTFAAPGASMPAPDMRVGI